MNCRATILLTLMKLDIGGAETHVVVLARHLTEMGYRVVMASNGGCFEKEIAGFGVKHYRVPLHQPKISCLWRSICALRAIVRAEKVDLIHAHARIPAFATVLSGDHKKVCFITTAHFTFNSRGCLKYLSQWGEKTIAVSEDIKEHLIKKFGVPAEKITVIPNGIDTEAFCPAPEEKKEGVTGIALIGRLDGELARVALNLITACEMISGQVPETHLVIAGDGDRRAEVEKAAGIFNRRQGKKVITMLGARTDINKIMAASDLVIGVSRVALEAMSCAKPVLLAGPQGFGGLLDKHNLRLYQKDNFTTRSSGEKATAENLAASLQEFFSRPAGWRIATGQFFREFIKKEYSSQQMVHRITQIYEETLLSKKPGLPVKK